MKMLLGLLASIGRWAHNKLIAIETREAIASALPRGKYVKLSKCRCPYDHEGIWKILEYSVEANDYHIQRESDGKTDYARRDIMEVLNYLPIFPFIGPIHHKSV